MRAGCPGAAALTGTPTLEIKECPECRSEIELFSDEVSATCDECGFIAYNDLKSCVAWCRYARDCAGDEVVDRFQTDNATKQE
jgi:hypothetical protein